MENTPILLTYITCANKDEAERIARALLEDRLATCVNMLSIMNSLYWWNDVIEQKQEVLLIAKTTQEKQEDIKMRVKQLHSYETPAILFLNATAEEAYAAWIQSEIEKK